MAANPGSAAITAPKPNSDAVFIDASRQPASAAWLALTNVGIIRRQAKTATVRMPSTSAASTAHTPTWRETSIAIGLAAGVSASVAVGPYHFGIIDVKPMFAAATTA